MRVYLAEKESQGYDLARVIDSNFTTDKGCIRLSDGDVVTWGSGHLFALAEPDYYDPALKKWNVESLPILPTEFQWLPIDRVRKQLKIVSDLILDSDEVVVCSDYDREGQLIAKNILNYSGFSGSIKRIKLKALDHESIKRALDEMVDFDESISLYYSAVARSHSDWIVGINLTRLFSCLADCGEVINIGRVITPTINLICQRDETIRNFKPRDFYEVEADISVQNGSFKGKWVPDKSLLDPDGHVLDQKAALAVVEAIKSQAIDISSVERTVSSENPPMLFSQAKLQAYAFRHFGFTTEKTLALTQSMYEKKITTYPRTDCQFLPESQFAEASQILAKLSADPNIANVIRGCDLNKKPRAFNDKKMSGHAHNAIVPSLGEQNISVLTADEMKLYNIIRLHYIAQFYAPAQYDVLTIKAKCGDYEFIARGKTLTKSGYRVLFHSGEIDDTVQKSSSSDTAQDVSLLPNVNTGERGYVQNSNLLTKRTRAPKHYDEASLVDTMNAIEKYVDVEHDDLEQELRLGTAATQPSIIENLKKYGWVNVVKDHFEATEKAFKTMSILPDDIKSPSMTALWELGLDNIVRNGDSSEEFERNIVLWLQDVFSRCKTQEAIDYIRKIVTAKKSTEPVYYCEKCKSPLKLLKGKYGLFFICTNEQCKQIYKENNRKPLPLFNAETAPKCPQCGSPMKPGKSKFGLFWKCQNEQCGMFLNDVHGKPQMPEKCPDCGNFIFRHKGKFGYFWSCSSCKKIIEDLNGKPVIDTPKCPLCGGKMRLIKKSKEGKAITPFWSCTNYPNCKGTLDKNGKPFEKKIRGKY